MKVYPGLADAAADNAQAGLAWSNTARALGEGLAVAATLAGAFATTADVYARWECRAVN